MQIKLITGATTFEAAKNTIAQIDAKDTQFLNLVVVPDAFSMQAESLIFDCLNIKSTFNIQVVGITRLASKLLHESNIPYQRISALEEVFYVFKAINMCEDMFLYFKNCDVDMCRKILQLIKQLKACHVKEQQILPVGDQLLDDKMHDIKLVYSAYQQLLSDKLDMSALLQFFVENAQKNMHLSKINLYFCNFDSFTLEINDFICKLAKLVNLVCIGMAKPISLKNAYIYEDDILKKTTALAKAYNVNINVQNNATTLKGMQRLLAENLFGFDLQCQPNQNFLNVIAKNSRDEVYFVAKYIKQAVYNGARFEDFAIAVPDEKYFTLLKNVFVDYGICANMDFAVDLSDTILSRFVLKTLDMAKLDLKQTDLQYLASSPLLGVDEQVLNQIFVLDITDAQEFVQTFNQYNAIVSYIESFKNCRKISDFCSVIESVFKLVEQNHNAFVETIADLKKQSENKQAIVLLQNVVEKLKQLAGEETFSIFNFSKLLLLCLKNVKVETVPKYIDAVFVGDATDSYFEDVKNLFVLGAVAGNLPRCHSDNALVDDEDIKKLKIGFALEPEIRVLNRRNRLKLFELLQHAQQKLIICTPISQDGAVCQKAEFVEQLCQIFGKNTLHTSTLQTFDIGMFSQEEDFERLLFYLGCQSNFLSAYSHLYSLNKLPKKHAATLSYLSGALYKEEKPQILSPELLLPKVNISPSKLETYFACPFKHLIRYGANVCEKENILPSKRQFGTFLHLLLKNFVQEYGANIASVTQEQIDKFLYLNLQNFAGEVYHKKVLKPQLLAFLNREAKIVLKNVVKEQKCSAFKPTAVEKFVQTAEGDLNLVGVVDRIDEYGDYFRVLDYKTGQTQSVEKDLFYGKKLQLCLYASILAKTTGKTCAGVYYFDCQTKYKPNSQKLFKGVTLKDNAVVEAMDYTATDGKSAILGFDLKKSAKENEFAFKGAPTVESFNQLMTYARKITSVAIDEMKQGYMQAKPFKGSCDFCPYLCICRHGQQDGYRKTLKGQNNGT